MHDRYDLTEEEWSRLEPLLPDQTPRQGGRWADHRAVINGVLWRTRTSSPWRDLPSGYGHWKTVYHRHRRWSADGTWVGILAELRRGCDQSAQADDAVEWSVGWTPRWSVPISMPQAPAMHRRRTWSRRTS